MSETTEEGEWKFVYHYLCPFGSSEHPTMTYAWDGGRYVFLFWAEDWNAMNYFASLEDMPEYARRIVDGAISQVENWDVWDNEKSAPVFEPTEAEFQRYVENRVSTDRKGN